VVICLVIKPIVTYKGDRATISSNTSTLVTDSALTIANLIMYRKILDALTILSTILVLGILGGGFFTFKYVTSEQFKAKMMEQVMSNVSGLMPKVLDKGLPDVTGPSIPTKSLPKF
jgi:hypothetical protein